ncbi:MAG: FtsH protease activity modulator HflK [Pseudomonadota bacterium]
MPWQSQGGGSGGPWGGSGGGSGGGGGPWGGDRGGSGGGNGSGGGGGGGGFGGGGFGGGNRPQDLEEMIKRGQDKMRSMLPRGGLGGIGIAIVAGVLIVLWLLSGFYRVNPGEQGLVLRFGEWVNEGNLADAGLHWHLPYPIESSEIVNVDQVRQIDIGFQDTAGRKRAIPEERAMLTQDQNIIDIEFTVQWRITNAGFYLFNIREPEETIKAVAESAMRETIGQTDIQPALSEGRDEVARETQALIQRVLDEYQAGIQIASVTLQDAQPPQQVLDAFEDVQRAQQDQERVRNEAEAYRNKVVPEARGFAQRTIEEANAFKERVIKNAEGEAQAFIEVFNAYRQNPELTQQRLYLETMQTVLGDTEKLIMDAGVQDGVVPYLPLNDLRPRGQATSGATQTGGAAGSTNNFRGTAATN